MQTVEMFLFKKAHLVKNMYIQIYIYIYVHQPDEGKATIDIFLAEKSCILCFVYQSSCDDILDRCWLKKQNTSIF